MSEDPNIKPGDFIDKLGVDKSEEWRKNMVERCCEMFAENPSDFTIVMANVLGKSLPVCIVLGINKEIVDVSKFFFILGFMKGICFSEQTSKLNGLVKEK